MYLKHIIRKRYRGWRLLILVSVFAMGYLAVILPAIVYNTHHNGDLFDLESHSFRRLLAADENYTGFKYPPDHFSIEERRNGAVVLHVIGLIYMFVALAIVCDEFFVPSLSVVIEKLDISEDVAGATFMAAGGSAPELFTSLIGVFFSRDNVGIGTIVGSAVFNILFVIGMCAIVSKTVLDLTWWPLFRDVSFYSIDLVVLIVCFQDGEIVWWEALILFILYLCYVIFMKFNEKIEGFVKSKLKRRKTRVHSDDSLLNEERPMLRQTAKNVVEEIVARRKPTRSCSIPILHSGTNHFRHGVLQLMIHTIDPISESQVQEKAMQLHAVASTNGTDANGEAQNGELKNGNVPDKNSNKQQMQVHAISNGNMPAEPTTTVVSPSKSTCSPIPEEDVEGQGSSSTRNSNNTESTNVQSPDDTARELPEEDDEPLDMSWPPTWRKRITYVLLAPLVFPMWLTLPDTRRPEKRKWVWVTFFGSIIWIFVFSYLMVWWANQTGETIGIPNEVMGLTILAAGTSIPDLITSVIVAKKGFGDMAVSSSVGSNIFDITVGLPIPWLLFSAVYKGDPINVESNGLVCSVVMLFAMLITVVVTIGVSKWKMTKLMGGAMLVLYVVFVVLSVLLELTIIECPVQ